MTSWLRPNAWCFALSRSRFAWAYIRIRSCVPRLVFNQIKKGLRGRTVAIEQRVKRIQHLHFTCMIPFPAGRSLLPRAAGPEAPPHRGDRGDRGASYLVTNLISAVLVAGFILLMLAILQR